jgi:hypothetical protein
VLFAKLKPTARGRLIPSRLQQVFEAARAVDHALDDDTPFVGGEQDQVAAMDGLAEPLAEVVPPLKYSGVFGDPGTDGGLDPR